jgi:hypothetical protein
MVSRTSPAVKRRVILAGMKQRTTWKQVLGMSLITTAAACGGGGSSSGDPDAAIATPDADQTPDAAVPGEVTYSLDPMVLGPDGIEGQRVLYFNPDGSLADDTETDADGVASGEVLSGGTVVALIVLPDASGNRIALLHRGVEPGDELVLTFPAEEPSPERTLQVTVPTEAGATSYALAMACDDLYQNNGAAPTFPLTNVPCPASTWAVALASDAGGPIGALVDEDVATTGDATLTGDYEPLVDAEITVEGLSPVAESGAFVYSQFDGTLLTMTGGNNFGVGVEGLEVLAPVAALGDDPHVFAGYQMSRDGFFPRLALVSEPLGDGTLTISPRPLPWTSTPIYDTKAQAARWVESGEGSANFASMQLQFADPDGTVQWIIADGAPAPETLVLPNLPADAADFLPAPDAAVEINTFILFHLDGAKRDAARANSVFMLFGGFDQLWPGEGGHTSISGDIGA